MYAQYLLLMRLCALAFWGCAAALPALAQSPSLKLENITYTSASTLRDFVGLHLGDPDLWPYVLELNQIASPADLRDGAALGLPVQQVRAADAALQQALVTIQTATAQGAQVFAPVQIGQAVETHEDALVRRDTFAWGEVVDLSNIATLLAQEALEIAIAQRDRSAEAIVSDVHGSVQGRAPAEPSWSGRGRDDILVEFERVRTLSASTTQITFRDLSRLRLNANSNATIQRMRSDPLTGGEVTKVSLVNGDFYALLNQLSDRTAFEIDVPGVETSTQSGDFWVKNDQSGARFVNYDQRELAVTQGDTQVMLGKNEGVLLDRRGAQMAEVLDSPALQVPGLDAILYSGDADLVWSRFDGAAGYWLEVARDAGFNEMQVSEWGIEQSEFTTTALAPARYYWRVAALDQLGLPGQWSKPGAFTVRRDTTPPFLTVLAPGDGDLSEVAEIDVFGAAEGESAVLLNGTPVPLEADGSFDTRFTLQQGANMLTLQATDPAGNISEISQTVIFRPAAAVEITFDAGLVQMDDAFATRSDTLAVAAGTTATPATPVEVRDATGRIVVQTVTDAGGAIRFGVPVTAQPQTYEIAILGPTGAVEGRARFAAVRDQTPPKVILEDPLPRATDMPEVTLQGSAGDAVSLTLNSAAVPLNAGRFDLTLTLEADVNTFDLVATDAVGNLTARRMQTVFDIDPPEITSASATRPEGANGPIRIEVAATDASGLRRSATYLLSIGGVEADGFLRCDTASGICRADLPPTQGDLRLIEVAVDDYAGNTAFK